MGNLLMFLEGEPRDTEDADGLMDTCATLGGARRCNPQKNETMRKKKKKKNKSLAMDMIYKKMHIHKRISV